MSYHDRLTKNNIKLLEYKIEFDLITFFKLINGETTISMQSIFKSCRNNYLMRENSKKNK